MFGADKPAKARAAIAAKGAPVEYLPLAAGTLDPVTLEMTNAATGTLNVPAVVRDVTATRDGTVAETMRVFMLAALDVPTPQPGDRITHNGSTWTLDTAQTTFAGRYPVLHTIRARAV